MQKSAQGTDFWQLKQNLEFEVETRLGKNELSGGKHSSPLAIVRHNAK